MEECIAKLLHFLSSLKPYSQVGIGAVSGWLTGFLTMKIGKFTAIILGGAIIAIKIAEIEGLLKINWLEVKENVQNIPIKSSNNFTIDSTTKMDPKIHNFLISFVGGSLIGIGCS